MSLNISLSPLFDVSGNTTLFGESFGEDAISGHLAFSLDMRSDANYPFSVTDLTNTFCIGDHDSSYNIFFVKHPSYDGYIVDTFCEKLAKAIIFGKLKQITPTSDHSTEGIPIGGGALVDASGNINIDASVNLYQKKWLTSISPETGSGNSLGECLARVMCVHLLGHPLSQALFVDEDNISTLMGAETATNKGASQEYFDNILAMQLSKALGGSVNSVPLKAGLDCHSDNVTGVEKVTGVNNSVLLSIYEQLVNTGGRTDDISGAQTVTGTTRTTIAPLPFRADDILTIYLRPTAKISYDSNTTTVYNSNGDILNIPGVVTSSATGSSMSVVYPGASAGVQLAEASKFSWIGSPDNTTGTTRDCNQDLTDFTDPNMFDGHIWKINITL